MKTQTIDKSQLRIIFLGTPGFAVPTLEALIHHRYQVVAVITAPDRIGGRGRNKVIESAVKKYALQKGLKILQPPNLKNATFLDQLRKLNAHLQIIVAFRMLPEVVWNMPPLGTYNLHASLLPEYRGAAPINWAIINGDEYTGVTTFKLKHQIDTGNIAFQQKVEIQRSDYLDDVHDRLKDVGADLMIRTVDAICDGTLKLEEQDNEGITKAPKIYHEDCELDFSMKAFSLYNKVRGLSPYPAAWTHLGERKIKIYKAQYADHFHGKQSGIFITNGKDFLGILCTNGILFIEEIQMEGSRRMEVAMFLNGFGLKKNRLPFLLQIESPWQL